MRKTLALPASFLAPPRRWLSLGMVALLIATALFAAVPSGNVSAAVCTSAVDGAWDAGATWSGCTGLGNIPAVDDVVTVTHSVSIAADQAVGSLTIGAGGLVFFTAPATLTISGISGVFEVNGGTLAAEILDENGDSTGTGGTIAFAAGAQQILTHGAWVDFWDLTKVASGAGQSLSFDPAGDGGVHIVHSVTLSGDATDNLVLQSTVPDSQWQIWPDDLYAIDYVDVKDSKNASPSIQFIQVAHGVDSGNNTAWVFGAPEVVLTSNPNPAAEDNIITFTATTTPTIVGGNVTFMNGAAAIQDCVDVSVENGVATCAVNDLDEGAYSITAVYSSFGPFAPVTSNTISQVIGNVVTVTLQSLANPAAADETLTIQASILPDTTVGTVEFYDGGTPIAGCEAVAISAGKAVCQVALGAGSHEVTAEYIEGDAHSTILNQVVKNLSTVTLASSHPFASYGQVVTFTATVTDPADATGTVTFKQGNSNIPGCVDVALVDGAAACDVFGLMPGAYNFSVVYSGDATTFGLEPAAIAQNVDLIHIYAPMVRR